MKREEIEEEIRRRHGIRSRKNVKKDRGRGRGGSRRKRRRRRRSR